MKINQIVLTVGRLSKKWLDPHFAHRRQAVQTLQKNGGYPQSMAEEILDDLFGELTEKKLKDFLISDIGNPQVLDHFCVDPNSQRKIRAFGPKQILHVLPANVPNPSIVSIVLGLLAKSRNAIKVSSRDLGLLPIYLESLRAHAPELAKTCTIFKSRSKEDLDSWMRKSDAVAVYGQEETIRYFHEKLLPGQTLLSYGPRMSFGIYLSEALKSSEIPLLAKKTAKDVWLMNQEGCLSPLVLWVEAQGGKAHHFCQALAETLEKLPESAGRFAASSQFSQARLWTSQNKNPKVWKSSGKSPWQVLYDESPSKFPTVLGGKNVYVKGFKDFSEVKKALQPLKTKLQAVAFEGSGARSKAIAEDLASLGFNRICRAGQLQKPSLLWHHEGQTRFARWLRWTDLELSKNVVK